MFTMDDMLAIVKPHNDKIIAEGRAATLADENAKLRTALTKLSNEVLGSLPLMDPLARREFGNTNYALLIQRAEEARALLGRDSAPYGKMCRDPKACAGKGYCPRDPTCGD